MRLKGSPYLALPPRLYDALKGADEQAVQAFVMGILDKDEEAYKVTMGQGPPAPRRHLVHESSGGLPVELQALTVQ